jgi:hypothetical protein
MSDIKQPNPLKACDWIDYGDGDEQEHCIDVYPDDIGHWIRVESGLSPYEFFRWVASLIGTLERPK